MNKLMCSNLLKVYIEEPLNVNFPKILRWAQPMFQTSAISFRYPFVKGSLVMQRSRVYLNKLVYIYDVKTTVLRLV